MFELIFTATKEFDDPTEIAEILDKIANQVRKDASVIDFIAGKQTNTQDQSIKIVWSNA